MISKIDNNRQISFEMKILKVKPILNKTNSDILDFAIVKTEENVRFTEIPGALKELGNLYTERFKNFQHKRSGKQIDPHTEVIG